MKDKDGTKLVFSILENPNLTWSVKDSITRHMEKYNVCFLQGVPTFFFFQERAEYFYKFLTVSSCFRNDPRCHTAHLTLHVAPKPWGNHITLTSNTTTCKNRINSKRLCGSNHLYSFNSESESWMEKQFLKIESCPLRTSDKETSWAKNSRMIIWS